MSAGPPAGGAMPYLYDKTPLSHLLEAAVQKTYHELYTMADVLQSKNTLDRKIELVSFACRARQLFIRVLAVVRWAATAGRVNICDDIHNFLENRARLIRETSDSLAQLAREKLIDARLANFPITDTVDALTLGSVNFLPERISEATTPFMPATDAERQEILPRLQQILAARVAISELPLQFTSVTIKNGLVTLAVEGEFEVKLGITSDNLFAPWHVYKTKLFLRDPEEPEQDLVHPIQMQTLTNFIQSWLVESENPLVELYKYLHYYCQSMRLQILVEQAHRIRNRSAKQKHLHISGYVQCKSFNVEYWKDYNLNGNNNNNNHQGKKPIINDKIREIGMTIVCDDEGKFQIIHSPPLPIDDSVAIMQILEKPTCTMEEILNRTIYARCQRRFEELKETILATTSANIEIDPSIPALKCELLPKSIPEEILFISISPFSGLYKVVSYMETRYSQQIESALNREQTNLIEAINLFKVWLIQQRVPPLLAHLNCRVYTRLPSLNQKHELIASFTNNTVYIELMHNEGYYILVHVSDVNQLLIQYYLLIVEKRSSAHDPLIIQQQQQQQQHLHYTQQPTPSADDGAKWILEPLVICPLDPTAFLRKEMLQLKTPFQFGKSKESIEEVHGLKQARAAPVLTLNLLLKLVNYYDEMLTFTFLKEEFQRKKMICKGIIYSPWTGIPLLDIVRTSTNDEFFTSNMELANYIGDCFWPRARSCTIRLAYTLRDIGHAHKNTERQWTVELKLIDNNYFHNSLIKTPYSAILVCTHVSSKLYGKIVDYIRGELRAAFELTHLFENYALALSESIDLRPIAEVTSFNFFKCTLHYGPNFAFAISIWFNPNQSSIEMNGTFDLRFTTISNKFLANAHHTLNGKLTQFLNRTRSLKQFLRLLHMTAIPIASIARLNCFNRPIMLVNQGCCAQPILTLVPYTESRWRVMFGQFFAFDIQACGPNLILVRDGAYSVQLNATLPELMPIPRVTEFLAKYADDRGLTFEFSQITDRFRDRDFIVPELQLPPPPPPVTTAASANRQLPTSNAATPHLLHAVGTPASLNPLTPASVGGGSQSQTQANSPSQQLIAPSPGYGATPSPMIMTGLGSPMTTNTTAQLTAPSPMGMATPSPAPNLYEMSYSSPAARQPGSSFPGSLLGPSPGTPAANIAQMPPSNVRLDETASRQQSSSLHSYNRHLYTKPHYPVYMTQQSFFRMLYTSDGHQWSRFESFLASSVLVRHFSRAVTEPFDPNNPTVRPVPNEQDTYRIENLSLQISFQFDTHTANYRIRFVPLFDSNIQQQQSQSSFPWTSEELQTLETFLNDNFFPTNSMPGIDILSLQAIQNRTTTMGAFERMLSIIHPRLLRDLVKIIRFEQTPEQHHLWRARWCLTIPYGNGFSQAGYPQVGNPAIFAQPGRSTFLFIFQFIPRMIRNEMQTNNNTLSFVIPLIHDTLNNQTTLWDGANKQPSMSNDVKNQSITKVLSAARETIHKNDCTLFPTIFELVTRLQLPSVSNYAS